MRKLWFYERDWSPEEKAVLAKDSVNQKALLVVLGELSKAAEEFRKSPGCQ